MQVPHGALIAVADGAKFNLFRNTGDEAHLKLSPLPSPEVSSDNKGSGGRHHSSSANPDDSQIAEDGFSAGTAQILNHHVLEGKVEHVLIIAAPRTLGELRKHYHKSLSEKLLGELPKDLTGHAAHDIEKAIAAA